MLDPKYADCRRGEHTPDTNVDTQQNGSWFEVQTVCTICGGMMDATIRSSDWNVVYGPDDCCSTCGEAALHCECG